MSLSPQCLVHAACSAELKVLGKEQSKQEAKTSQRVQELMRRSRPTSFSLPCSQNAPREVGVLSRRRRVSPCNRPLSKLPKESPCRARSVIKLFWSSNPIKSKAHGFLLHFRCNQTWVSCKASNTGVPTAKKTDPLVFSLSKCTSKRASPLGAPGHTRFKAVLQRNAAAQTHLRPRM